MRSAVLQYFYLTILQKLFSVLALWPVTNHSCCHC